MLERRRHYDQAFEVYARRHGISCVPLALAAKAILPDGEPLRTRFEGQEQTLKAFDAVLYGSEGGANSGGVHLLAEIKGRRVSRRRLLRARPASGGGGGGDSEDELSRPRLESWVTLGDLESLRAWEELFGPPFRAAFVFVYWCDERPPAALRPGALRLAGRWYSVRVAPLREYVGVAKVRSARWGTVDVAPADFERISAPLAYDASAVPAGHS